jgi:hypothetical protein
MDGFKGSLKLGFLIDNYQTRRLRGGHLALRMPCCRYRRFVKLPYLLPYLDNLGFARLIYCWSPTQV